MWLYLQKEVGHRNKNEKKPAIFGQLFVLQAAQFAVASCEYLVTLWVQKVSSTINQII